MSLLGERMAYNDASLMGCCVACGGPFESDRSVIRKDGVASRSLNYIEEQICRDSDAWGVASGVNVKLVSEKQRLHMVHKSNFIPVLESFVDGGKLEHVWLRDDLPGFDKADPHNIAKGTRVKDHWYCITNPAKTPGGRYRFVTWERPLKLKNLNRLFGLIKDCVNRSNHRAPVTNDLALRSVPSFKFRCVGCKECNDFMTQEGTIRHLLVRDVISNTPLVPMNKILRYDLSGPYDDPSNRPKITSDRYDDPSVSNVSSIHFSFQAAIAYYIHRCLPREEIGVSKPLQNKMKHLYVLFAFCLLEVLSLMYERHYGIQGGAGKNFDKRNKPAYRYKGLAELYVSYMLWNLLVNDVAEGEAVGGRAVDLQFEVFHRYYFKEILSLLAIAHDKASDSVEILDLIFSEKLFGAGRVSVMPGRNTQIHSPEDIIGYMAESIFLFYGNWLRLYFSRHMAGLGPMPLAPGASDLDKQRFAIQMIVFDMLISRDDLDTLLRICERAAPGDIDSCMNHVGVHAVVGMWLDVLTTAPDKVNRLIREWVDAWTLREYINIQEFMRQNPAQPRLSEAVAESIYLLCNSLEDSTEPTNQDELEVLKAAPKCSVYKAALRLERTGAFRDE